MAVEIPDFLSNISVILVEPQSPGNIGSTARAMKTMGLSRLVLVNPVEYRLVSETRWLAHGADDVLDAAVEASSLDEALADVIFAVGTTNRGREHWFNPIEVLHDVAPKIIAAAQTHHVAFVFGREDHGLTNEALEKCHLIVRIPAAVEHPSLNLSQAVMVCVYEIFQAAAEPPPPVRLNLADSEEIERITRRIATTMLSIGFTPTPVPETFIRALRRVFRRSLRLELRDLATIHKICDQIDYYVRTWGQEAESRRQALEGRGQEEDG